jgi:hypothetical protein
MKSTLTIIYTIGKGWQTIMIHRTKLASWLKNMKNNVEFDFEIL